MFSTVPKKLDQLEEHGVEIKPNFKKPFPHATWLCKRQRGNIRTLQPPYETQRSVQPDSYIFEVAIMLSLDT